MEINILQAEISPFPFIAEIRMIKKNLSVFYFFYRSRRTFQLDFLIPALQKSYEKIPVTS